MTTAIVIGAGLIAVAMLATYLADHGYAGDPVVEHYATVVTMIADEEVAR